ncbi:MAG: serine hydrolase [Salibacteraceae bacterium]
MKLRALLFALLMGLFALSEVQAQAPKKLADLDAYLEAARKSYELPGLAIGIVKDGKMVYQKGFGVRDISTNEKVDVQTVFAIASLSKAFTAASVGLMVDEGKLSWDDRVKDHLPELQLHDPYITSQLTVRDLLCHRSGLRTFDGDLLWYGTDYSRDEILQRIRQLPVQYDFRARFGYQNIMFIGAGELVPRITGSSWDDYVKQRIFQPLGMTNSYTSIRQFPDDINLAMPHVKGEKDRLLNYDNSGGAATINSCVADLSKWMQMWLDQDKEGGTALLKSETINTIFSNHTNLRVRAFDQENGTHFKGYGLGWFLMDYQGVKVVHHGGGLPGYISKLALVPEQNLGIIVLTNGETSLPSALMYQIIDLMNDRSDRDWAQEFLAYKTQDEQQKEEDQKERENSRVKGTRASVATSALVGTYRDEMYGDATVKLQDGKLYFVMEPAKTLFQGALNHWHYDTYEIRLKDRFLPPGYITFEFDSKGAVKGFTIDLPNPDFHFYNLHFLKN